MQEQMKVPSILWHRPIPLVSLPILSILGKGLGGSQKYSCGLVILDLYQGVTDVESNHGGRHILPPKAEASRAPYHYLFYRHKISHWP